MRINAPHVVIDQKINARNVDTSIMPPKHLKPCKQPGCPALVTTGYCDHHAPSPEATRERFKALDDRMDPEIKRFYHGARWTAVSLLHRAKEPLCRSCKKEGRIVCGELTHHNPPLEELLREGKDPYADVYLEASCTPCHMRELNKKRYSRIPHSVTDPVRQPAVVPAV